MFSLLFFLCQTIRPGGHDLLPERPIDKSAFSLSRKTETPQPHNFIRKGTGGGGSLMLVICIFLFISFENFIMYSLEITKR